MIGQSLAHYEITALLGKGGMGSVYRARDTKLGRDVALKLLPSEFSEDPERVARFEREARTLATLQHANIATIHGFEKDQGQRFLIMELVEGEDLAKRLESGPIPLDDALRIASQIAAALESAHDASIVHRDLKPANVMLAKDGNVKILDFGLARAYAAEDLSEEELAHSPTLTAAMTQAGTILGTAAYMSPEQARGHAIDRRADNWAFGVILFEMLTGTQLFSGGTVSDTLAAVLRAEPDWAALPKDTPRALVRLIRRCLQRDPRERMRDAGDARLELNEVLTQPDTDEPETTPAASRKLLAHFSPWLLVLTLSLATALGWQLTRRDGPEPTLVEFDVNAPVGHALREFAVSPDGSALAAVATSRDGFLSLWLRELASAELRRLPGTDGCSFPFWSPDSRSIAFFAEGKLRRIDLANENVQTIANAPNGRGGAWSDDDVILFAPEGEAVLHTVPARGGTPQPLTEFKTEGVNTHRFPHFVPGSRRFTFSAHSDDSATTHRFLGSLDGGAVIALPDGMSESYVTRTHLLYIRERDLVAQRFDPTSGVLSGEPVFLASGISSVYPRTGRAAFSVSSNGVLAYLPDRTLESHFSWHDGAGLLLENSRTTDHFAFPELSHDLQRILFFRPEGGSGNEGELWVHELARGSSRRLRDAATANGQMGWSHDDRSVLFPLEGKLWRQELDGGEPELILDTSLTKAAASMSAINEAQESSDGGFITFSAWDSSSDFDLWILRVDDPEPRRLIQSPRMQTEGRISPDDKWLAFSSLETGRSEVLVCGLTPPASGQPISAGGGRDPVWNEDGSELYYVAPDENLMAVSVRSVGGRLEFGLPRVVFRAPPGPGAAAMDEYFDSPELLRVHEGKFLFHTPAEEVPPRVLKLVLNWERRLSP